LELNSPTFNHTNGRKYFISPNSLDQVIQEEIC